MWSHFFLLSSLLNSQRCQFLFHKFQFLSYYFFHFSRSLFPTLGFAVSPQYISFSLDHNAPRLSHGFLRMNQGPHPLCYGEPPHLYILSSSSPIETVVRRDSSEQPHITCAWGWHRRRNMDQPAWLTLFAAGLKAPTSNSMWSPLTLEAMWLDAVYPAWSQRLCVCVCVCGGCRDWKFIITLSQIWHEMGFSLYITWGPTTLVTPCITL